MVTPTPSFHRTAPATPVASSAHAGPSTDPKQRLGIRARMDAFSHSVAHKGRHLTKGMFSAKPGSAASTPRSSRPPSEIEAPPRTPTPPPAEAMELLPRLTMQLEGQRLRIGDPDRPNHTERLLDGVLNKTGERYQALAELSDPAAAGRTEYLLVDTRNRLIHTQASDLAVSVFKSSDSRPNLAFSTAMPTDALRAQITGVHIDGGHDAWRVHENTLYHLHENRWTALEDAPAFKTLVPVIGEPLHALTAEGQVHSLADPETPLGFTHAVSALARTADRHLLALTQDSDKHMQLERLDASGANDVLQLLPPSGDPNDASMKPQSIAMLGSTLLATTASGKLLHAPLPDFNERTDGRLVDAEITLQELPPSAHLTAVLGKHTVSGFFHDEQGQLHLKVKDHKGIEHSAAWNAEAGGFVPGWNLSQALVMDRQSGLPALAPELDTQIQLPRGRIASHDNTLLTQDPRTGEWKKTSETSIKSLVAARDGFAYLIDKDGKLKQLKVAPQATAHDMGQGVDLALPGRTTEAKGTIMRGAEHLTVDKVAVQNDQRYMTLSEGVLRLHDQNGERATLPPVPRRGDAINVTEGPITGIATQGKDWFALKEGKLHQISGDAADPKKASAARAWTPASLDGLPADATLRDLQTDHQGRMCLEISVPGAGADDPAVVSHHVRNAAGNWTPATPPTMGPAERPHTHFQNLANREPDFTRKGMLKTSFNVMGRNNVETTRPQDFVPHSLTQNYVTSHLASTGAFKVPADSVQHAWQGRAGLKEVYTREIDTLRDLTAMARARPQVAPNSMAARLATLDRATVGAPVTELMDLIEWFQQTVNDDMQKTLRELAERKGALHNSGDANLAFKPGKPPRTDLLNEVAHVLEDSGVKRGEPLGQLVERLQGMQFTLEHRNPGTADQSRKRGNDETLLCARLAANAQVLKKLSAKVDDLAANPGRPKEDLDRFAAELAALHNDEYDGHPLKRYTDAGFRSYAALEASYDATKSLLKYMRKDNHPLKRNLLEGLQSTPDDLTENLTQALRDLEPRESLKINRNYGGGVTAGVSAPVDVAFLGFRGAADRERTYGMTFTRFDRGLKVSVSREGATTGTGSFGFGGGRSDTKTTAGDSHNNIQSNSGWFGGSLDAKYKYTDNTALSFFVREDEMDDFMNDLLNAPLHSSQRPEVPGLKPMDLMNRSVEQEVRTTGKHSFDLDLGVNVESRTNYGQTDAEPVAGFMRFGIGLLASVTLMSAERERTQGRGNDGLKTDIYSSNRARFLEKGTATGYARMFSTIFSSRPDNLFIAGGAPIGVAATLSVDSKTGKTYDVRFKDALPVQASDVKNLASSLEKAFPELTQTQHAERPVAERLAALHTQYADRTPQNDAQHAALMSLAQTRRQQQASDQGSALMSLMDMVVKHNNVNRIDQAAMSKRGIDVVKEMLGRDVNPGNAERIHQMMNDDPQLKALLDELKASKGTTRAEIKLEVTDTVKQRIEDGALGGRLSDAALKNQLSNRDNLRIKSIAVFRSAAKDDSLGVPLPYVSYKSGSSLAIERLMGELTFEYGADQLHPKKVTADGEIADRGDFSAAQELGTADRGEFRAR